MSNTINREAIRSLEVDRWLEEKLHDVIGDDKVLHRAALLVGEGVGLLILSPRIFDYSFTFVFIEFDAAQQRFCEADRMHSAGLSCRQPGHAHNYVERVSLKTVRRTSERFVLGVDALVEFGGCSTERLIPFRFRRLETPRDLLLAPC